MSGKKQHHIPQSLQRGFLFDVKAEKTFVHRRNGFSRPASIADVAAQRFFYSRPSSDGTKTLDDEITDYEDRLGRLLAQLRTIPLDSPVDAAIAAEVITHLTPRSANIRRMFRRGMKQILTAAEAAFSDEDTLMRVLGLDEPEPSPVWNGHLTGLFEKQPQLRSMLDLIPIPSELLNRLLFMATKEHFVGGDAATTLGIAEAFAALFGGLEELVRDGHNKALGKGLVAPSRKQSLEALQWHVRPAPPEGAIMPDCVAIGIDEQGGTFIPYLLTKVDSVSAVVMALSSNKLLVGVRPGHVTPVLVDFNREASACSDELFITASNEPVFADVGAHLGQRWNGELDALIQGVLRDVLPNKAADGATERAASRLPSISFQLTFSGIGATEEDVAPLSRRIHDLVSLLLPHFRLERLDGITFSATFQEALDAVPRGWESINSPEVAPDFVTQGVATILVLRNGIVKVRVVLNAAYGLSLVGDEPQDAEIAMHLLVAGLAQVDTVDCIETTLPGFLMKPVMMSDHDAILHCAMRQALRAYRYARDSAGFGGDALIEQEFTKYFASALDNAVRVLTAAKEDHATKSDFSKLFEAADSTAGNVLTSAARLIGHRHGMERADLPFLSADVPKVLAARQLTGWFQVFARDLERFWKKDTWTQADFYALNIHVERVLLAHGIALWREANSQGTMIAAAPLR